MHEGITASTALTVFLLLTSATFLFLTGSWTDHSLALANSIGRDQARLESAMAVSSASGDGAGCTTYVAEVDNTGEGTVADFAEMDLVVEYTDESGGKVAAWLEYSADWSVAGITPDTRDPNLWNAGETATISFTLPSGAKAGTNGTVVVSTPLAVSDSKYFSCS